MFLQRSFRVLLDTDPPAGGGGGGGNTDPPAGDKGADLVKAVEGLVAKHGDTTAALRVLLGENYGLRDANRELKSKLPADGAVILIGDDAKAWGQFRTLGKFEDVETRLKERDTLDGQVKAHAREKHLAAVAGLHGFDAEVLTQLAGPDLELRVADRTVNGKAVKVAQVVGKDDKGAEVLTDLDKHAEAHWAKFLPSLKAVKAGPAPGGTPPRRTSPAPHPAPESHQPTRPKFTL